jgi:transcriptional regulator with XRE-family HTH domain
MIRLEPYCTSLYNLGMQTTAMSPLMKRRKELGLTRAKAAKLIGTTQQSVNRWELGRCRPHERFIPKLAKALRISKGAVVDAVFTPTP